MQIKSKTRDFAQAKERRALYTFWIAKYVHRMYDDTPIALSITERVNCARWLNSRRVHACSESKATAAVCAVSHSGANAIDDDDIADADNGRGDAAEVAVPAADSSAGTCKDAWQRSTSASSKKSEVGLPL